MRLKDHYQTLGIASSATLQDVKKAYRKLALQYHPDKTQDDPLATARFKEIHDAYHILSNTERRRVYDEELWLSGMGGRMHQQEQISSQWILKEVIKLRQHMATIDTYRMSHQSLRDYILLLLSDAHLAVLQRVPEQEINSDIIHQMLIATKNLDLPYQAEVMQQLVQVANGDSELLTVIYTEQEKRKKQYQSAKLLPLWVIIATILLCFFMYLYVRKS